MFWQQQNGEAFIDDAWQPLQTIRYARLYQALQAALV